MARALSTVSLRPFVTSSESFLMSPSMVTSWSGPRKTLKEPSGSEPSPASFSRSVLISCRVQTNFMVISAAAPGDSISAYAMRLPYLDSFDWLISREKVRSRIAWTVESWGTGSHTRSFFVPAGMSLTWAVYVMANVRESPGLRKSLETTWTPSWGAGVSEANTRTTTDAI